MEVSVFKYQPGVQSPVEQLHSYRINSRGAVITGSLAQTEERRGENVSGSVDIAAGGAKYFLFARRSRCVVPVNSFISSRMLASLEGNSFAIPLGFTDKFTFFTLPSEGPSAQ